MKTLFILGLSLISVSAHAIAFISEEDVAEKLSAEKVIEVSKYSIEALVQKDSECAQKLMSRSARAYIVKANKKASLVVTEENLDGLTTCVEL